MILIELSEITSLFAWPATIMVIQLDSETWNYSKTKALDTNEIPVNICVKNKNRNESKMSSESNLSLVKFSLQSRFELIR